MRIPYLISNLTKGYFSIKKGETMKDTFVLFNGEKGLFGMNIHNVVSIEKVTELSNVPEMPEYMVGMVNIRGQVIPVVDISRLLFKRSIQIDEHTRYILVETSKTVIALMVARTNEILDIDQEQVKPVKSVALCTSAFIKGVTMLDNQIITILDIEELLLSLQITEHIN